MANKTGIFAKVFNHDPSTKIPRTFQTEKSGRCIIHQDGHAYLIVADRGASEREHSIDTRYTKPGYISKDRQRAEKCLFTWCKETNQIRILTMSGLHRLTLSIG